jgi:uncharacterized membrane protein YphA (DoxX/SURF4 family)
MPFPEITANVIGVVGNSRGLLLISGFLTRFISFIFIGEMIVAILSTKITLYLGTYPLPLPSAPPQIGSGQCCTKYAPITHRCLTSAFLLFVGADRFRLTRISSGNPRELESGCRLR